MLQTSTALRPRRVGRLFWKLFFWQWLGMSVMLVGLTMYVRWSGAQPTSDANAALFGVPLAIAVLTTTLTSVGFSWYLSRPIRELSWALRRFSEGHLDTRVRGQLGRCDDEIADLAADFDAMAQQWQQLNESSNLLLHDVSHELRSPLARLQVAIGLLKQDPISTESMLGRIERESQKLDGLIEQLLTWHRLRVAGNAQPATRIDVMDLVHSIAEDAAFEAQPQQKTVRFEASGEFVMLADADLLYRAYENVIRNAVKFTRSSSEVLVRATVDRSHEHLHCVVRDHGPGVPAGMLDAIFSPFFRVVGSSPVRGVGLGLAIAKRAFDIHGGSIRAEVNSDGGLTMTMILPRRSPGLDLDHSNLRPVDLRESTSV